MAEKLTHNFGYKLLSLVIAAGVWLLIINAEDPVYTRNFGKVPVTEINASVITESGKAYSFVDGLETVDVTVTGRTSLVNKVSKDDISAVVDLSKLYNDTGAVMVDVTCEKYPSLEVATKGSTGILRIEIENLVEKVLNVQVITTGNPPEGRFMGTGAASPNMITVSGPESVVNTVAGAVVRIPVSRQNTGDIDMNSEVQLIDAAGDEVKDTLLNVSQEKIRVRVPVFYTKEVPLKLNVVGIPDSGRVQSAEYEPKTITIAGTKGVLKKISEIELKDYDLTGKSGNIEDSLNAAENLKEALPEGVVLTDPAVNIALAVQISAYEESQQETMDPEELNQNMPADD